MNIESLREYCLGKEWVTEDFPFGPDVLVFRVQGKIFLLVPIHTNPLQFNAKCDPEKVIELREQYPCVLPGYHMNKTHWNTIIVDGSVRDALICEWIDHSYDLILASLPKKKIAKPAVKKKVVKAIVKKKTAKPAKVSAKKKAVKPVVKKKAAAKKKK